MGQCEEVKECGTCIHYILMENTKNIYYCEWWNGNTKLYNPLLNNGCEHWRDGVEQRLANRAW